MLQDLDYFDQQYQSRQDDAALDAQADGASDGFDGKEAQMPFDSAYMSGYWQGKQAKTGILLDQCLSTLEAVKSRACYQQSRLDHLGRMLEIVANRVLPEEGEF